jgi:S1-C subfamily serine protease
MSLLSGKGNGTFDPGGRVTVAEAVALAARLHKTYTTGDGSFPAGSPWYAPYIRYASDNGIIPPRGYPYYNNSCTRAEFAVILANALPDEALTPIGNVENGAIADVSVSYSYGEAVYKLYRAGIITGADKSGRFFPARSVTRADAAVIAVRMAVPDERAEVFLKNDMPAVDLFDMCSKAVFFIQVYDNEEKPLKTGSGFFISKSGVAVTNYHVIVGGKKATATLSDGTVLQITGVYDYDRKADIALLQISATGDVPFLESADSSALLTGATVYTIGSPLGLTGSMSKGIISGQHRDIFEDEFEYIQYDASISPGSSGGALIDSSGRVIGITSASATNGQNANFAVPVNFISDLKLDNYVPLDKILSNAVYYADLFPVPDFGAYSGASAYETVQDEGEKTFYYRAADIKGEQGEILEGYYDLLEQNIFTFYGTITYNSIPSRFYINSSSDIAVLVGHATVKSTDSIVIAVVKLG